MTYLSIWWSAILSRSLSATLNMLKHKIHVYVCAYIINIYTSNVMCALSLLFDVLLGYWIQPRNWNEAFRMELCSMRMCSHKSNGDCLFFQCVFRSGEGALQVLPPLIDVLPEARLNLVIYYLKQGLFCIVIILCIKATFICSFLFKSIEEKHWSAVSFVFWLLLLEVYTSVFVYWKIPETVRRRRQQRTVDVNQVVWRCFVLLGLWKTYGWNHHLSNHYMCHTPVAVVGLDPQHHLDCGRCWRDLVESDM